MEQDSAAVGRYRPTSMADFGVYAKNLAWLIEEPLQRSQELLARIYGYSGLHELQTVMKTKGQPGPFDYQWFDHHDDPSAPRVDTSGRHNRVLQLVGELKQRTLVELDHRYWEAASIDLFNPPQTHRASFARVRAKIEVANGEERGPREHAATDYAQLDRSARGEVLLRFTDLGQAVYDAVHELLPDRYGGNRDNVDPDEAEERIREIAERHPNNPWPLGMLVCGFASAYWQGGWADNLHHDREDGFALDPNPGLRKYAVAHARDLLPDAHRAIMQFEALLDGAPAGLADHRLVTEKADTFTPMALYYWGGVIALNAGNEKLAKRWLARNHKLADDDNWGARYYLAAIALNSGKGSIRRLFRKDSDNVWACLALAAEAAHKGDWAAAAAHYGAATAATWAAQEAFLGHWEAAREQPSHGSNHATPAFVQEFMHRTRRFWDRHPVAQRYFTALAEDAEVQAAVLAHAAAKRAIWGSAERGLAYIDKIEQQEKAARAQLLKVVTTQGATLATAIGQWEAEEAAQTVPDDLVPRITEALAAAQEMARSIDEDDTADDHDEDNFGRFSAAMQRVFPLDEEDGPAIERTFLSALAHLADASDVVRQYLLAWLANQSPDDAPTGGVVVALLEPLPGDTRPLIAPVLRPHLLETTLATAARRQGLRIAFGPLALLATGEPDLAASMSLFQTMSQFGYDRLHQPRNWPEMPACDDLVPGNRYCLVGWAEDADGNYDAIAGKLERLALEHATMDLIIPGGTLPARVVAIKPAEAWMEAHYPVHVAAATALMEQYVATHRRRPEYLSLVVYPGDHCFESDLLACEGGQAVERCALPSVRTPLYLHMALASALRGQTKGVLYEWGPD